MPAYRFQCPQCQSSKLLLVSRLVYESPCDCGSEMQRQLPSELSSVTLEMRDSHRGVQLPKNHEKNMKTRLIKHHDKYELADKIDQHGLEDAQKHGWLDKSKGK